MKFKDFKRNRSLYFYSVRINTFDKLKIVNKYPLMVTTLGC